MNQSLIGQTLGGRYRIEEKIGEGGMSAVYRAFDPNLQRVVAIKVIKTALAGDRKFLARFESEATAVAQLRHPNIVQVFDFSHDDELYYMVQEFVAGETLQDRLKRLHAAGRELSVADAVHYALNICDAAGYAHQRGLIHRDIKPANIMLDVHGNAILMDFGIVKILGGVEHTVAGAVVGTALYMPPELIRGEVPDARTDVYSLGVVLFEMLSGHPPFEADSAMTLLMMHLQDPVPDLHKLRPTVPEALCDVVQKALSKDRADRYASMGEMATALGQKPSGAVLSDRPASPAGQSMGDRTVAEQGLPIPTPPAAGQTAPEQAVERAAGGNHAGRVWEPAAKSAAGGLAEAQSMPAGPRAVPGARSLLRRWPLWLGATVVLLALIGGGILLAQGRGGKENAAGPSPSTLPETGAGTLPTAEATTAADAGHVMPTQGAGHVMATPTAPAGRITMKSIELDGEQRYVVSFISSGFTEPVSGTMMHFFFNNVLPQDAGAPGIGPWRAHSGSSPFTAYTAADRPERASALCVLAATAGDGVIPGTGNCIALPDVQAATSSTDIACYFGPGESYPQIATLRSGQFVTALGLSGDELWYNVLNPEERPDSCWVSTVQATVSGDLSQLNIVEGPAPDATPEVPAVTITEIISDSGQYVVTFNVQGFEPRYPGGTHLHFFFNNVTADQVGIGGDANRRSFGSKAAFTLYSVRDRPAAATQMCVVVANPNHSVMPNTESCMRLPGLPSVEITNITIDAEQHYVVDFDVARFTPRYPGGPHIHFFFNTFTPDQVGIGGEANRRSHGEPPPFTAFTVADRPQGATEMCAVVANPNHSVVEGSGNCFRLPDAPAP